MANIILVQFLILLVMGLAHAKLDKTHSETYLGEKRLDAYSERYYPLVNQDLYRGKMSFQDEDFFQKYFETYSLPGADQYDHFLRSELSIGMSCPNELFSEHYDEIRYSYRLITLSYLLEGQWHLKLLTDHFRLKKGCEFDLLSWAKSCRPKSAEMKKFIANLIEYNPKYSEPISPKYEVSDWLKNYNTKKFDSYSHYRLEKHCGRSCDKSAMEEGFKNVCRENLELLNKVCNEIDEVYGLSNNREAYFLLGQSNIINTFNRQGEAQACMRRFSEVMAHREVNYESLQNLFAPIQSTLRQQHNERFLQGRVFFFGAGKEYEAKGLKNLYVKEQLIQVKEAPKDEVVITKPVPLPRVKKPAPEVLVVKEEPVAPKKEIVEIREPSKSAFLQASELRASQDLNRVEVDMLKFKYDYVFTLYMKNTLSERLTSFMTREGLVDMLTFDKLGSKEGPVPLLFIKYMLDMQEHQGLWNLVSVVGNKFYVSNEIDAQFKPKPERVELSNQSADKQWQLFILKP